MSRNISVDSIFIHFHLHFLIYLRFFGSLKVALINMVAILMTSAKFATLELLKIIFFSEIQVMALPFLFMK